MRLRTNPLPTYSALEHFANKVTDVVYNDCTGDFPYMSLDKNVCFFIMYHYETNAILITLIAGLDSECILEAYTKNLNIL